MNTFIMNEHELELLKYNIEKLSKIHQIEILKIMQSDKNVTLNENKSGVYVNLSFLPAPILTKMTDYMKYVKEQDALLNLAESTKETYAKEYFEDNMTASVTM